MTVDIANTGRYVFYLNFRTEGTGSNFAESEQVFTFSNLIEDSSNYVVTIERFRVPLQTIPMYPDENNTIVLIPKVAVPTLTLSLNDSYSLLDFFTQLNAFQPGVLTFSLTSDGRVLVDYSDTANYDIQFTSRLADTLGLPENIVSIVPISVKGSAPIFDRFDQLHKVQIEAQTGLGGLQQEIVTTAVFKNLLTDFIVPSNNSMTITGREGVAPSADYSLAINLRQDLEFNDAGNRRYIMLKGNAPIQNISLEAVAIYRDGSRNRIVMAPNTIMELKLAFWKKS